MKIFILLALAGVSICNDYGGNYQPPIMCGPGGYGQGGPWSGEGGQSSGNGGGGSTGQGGSWSDKGGHSSGNGGGGSWSSWSSWSSSSSSSSSSSLTFQCDSTYKNDFAHDDKCLKHALENVHGLGLIGQKIICKYKDHKNSMTKEYFEELKEHMQTFLGCVGCGLGRVVGIEKPLGELTFGVGGDVSELLEAVEKIKEQLGLAKPLLNLVCSLLSPLFASKCVDKLLSKDVPAVTTNLKKILCQKDEELDVPLTMETLIDGGCAGDDALGTKDTLKNLTGAVGEAVTPAVKEVVKSLKDNALTGGLLKTICPVGEILDNIVNGGGDGPLGGVLGGGDNGLLGGVLGGGDNGLLGGVFGGGRKKNGLLGGIGRRR